MNARPTTNRRSSVRGDADEAPATAKESSAKDKSALSGQARSEGMPTYKQLSKLVTTWPAIFKPTGKAGFSSPVKWLETNGADHGVTNISELRALSVTGAVVAVPIQRLGDGLGGLDLSGRASAAVLIPNDPGTLRADPGPLRAQAWIGDGHGRAHTVTTSVSASLFQGSEGLVLAHRQVLAQVLPAAQQAVQQSGVADPLVRVAWVTNEGKVRIVEYIRSSTGMPEVPSATEDLEAMTGSAPMYTALDAVEDVVRGLHKPQGAQIAPATGIPGPSGVVSGALAAQGPIQTAQVAGNASPKGVSLAKPMFGGAFGGHQAAADVFAASQRVIEAGAKLPTRDSHHLVVVVNSLSDLNKKVVEGRALVHCGIVSNFGQMLAAGASSGGKMDASSKVFIAVRSGDTCQVVAMAPYSGLVPNMGAASLIIRPEDVLETKPAQFSLSELMMQRPNLPFVIGREIALNGFQIPATARQAVWKAIHSAQNWQV